MMAVPTNQTHTCTLHILWIIESWVHATGLLLVAGRCFDCHHKGLQEVLKASLAEFKYWVIFRVLTKPISVLSVFCQKHRTGEGLESTLATECQIFVFNVANIRFQWLTMSSVIIFIFQGFTCFYGRFWKLEILWTTWISKIRPSDVRLGNLQTQQRDLWAFLKGRGHPMEQSHRKHFTTSVSAYINTTPVAVHKHTAQTKQTHLRKIKCFDAHAL